MLPKKTEGIDGHMYHVLGEVAIFHGQDLLAVEKKKSGPLCKKRTAATSLFRRPALLRIVSGGRKEGVCGLQWGQECVFSTKAKSMFISVVLGGVLEPLCLAYNISVLAFVS